MSVYTSSRAKTYKQLKQQSESLGVGSSGKSLKAMERDMQRNIALEAGAQRELQPMPTNPVYRPQTTGGVVSTASAQTGSVPAGKPTVSTRSQGRGRAGHSVSLYGTKPKTVRYLDLGTYRPPWETDGQKPVSALRYEGVPVNTPGGQNTGAATTGSGAATTAPRNTHDRDAYDSGVRNSYANRPQSGYAPVYGPNALYNGAGNMEEGSDRTWYQTALDMTDHASWIVLSGATGLLDGAANLLPAVEGFVMGEDAEATFTAQLLRPITNLTGRLNDYAVNSMEASAQRWREDFADNSKAAQMAGELAVSAMAAIPYLATAFLTAGGSVAGAIATSAAGAPVLARAGNVALKQMVVDAAKQMAANPSWKVRFAQSFGNTYNEAKDKGATELEAITTATMTGYTMATMEQAGGVEKILNTKELLDRSGAGRLGQMLVSAGTEVAENMGQGVAEQVIHKGVYDRRMPLFSANDTDAVISLPRMGMETAEGLLLGGPFGIPALVRNGMDTVRYKTDIVQQALELPMSTKAHQDAKAITEQFETELMKAGFDSAEFYQQSRADQQKLIDKVMDEVLTDEAIGALAAALEAAVDARDKFGDITARSTTPIQQGISAFPSDDSLYENVKHVQPDGDKFDVAMHGLPTSVAFGGNTANMSPRTLAEVIRHNENYHGQDIRLLSCETGVQVNGDYCFAEELANALGVTVWAPNDLLFVNSNGTIKIGDQGQGTFVPFVPNQRRRFK